MAERKRVRTNIDLKRKVLTIFTLFFPTVIIVAMPNEIGGNYLLLGVKALLAFYQFVMLKNFVDTHYD